MAHKWEDYDDPEMSPAQRFISEPKRRCACCGFIQERQTDTWYMRIERRYWRPLAGRCTPPGIRPEDRPLWRRAAETEAGEVILDRARKLSFRLENRDLTDAQLIRLAYWGTPGAP